MAKNKQKKENLRKTEVPSTEILDKGAEVSEILWNKTKEIEGDEVISEKVSNSNDIYFPNARDEASSETSNQASEGQEEIPTENHQTPEDVQKSESDEQEAQSHTETEPFLTVMKQKNRQFQIFQMLMSGIISGAIGFGAAYYLFASTIMNNRVSLNDALIELDTNIKSNADGISQNAKADREQDTNIQGIMAKLETHIIQFEALAGTLPSMTNSPEAIDALKARVESIEMLTTDMGQLMAKLEKRPVAATLSSEAIAAYNSEVTKLIETMAAQRKEMETLLGDATAEKAQASKVARRTQVNLTFNAIQTAFNNGESFATELNEFAKLTNAQIPVDLQKIAGEGVWQLDKLIDTFPEVARAAIAADRSGESYDGTIQSLLRFLKWQVQARSVAPKEGTDADSVLSRAEAALREGKLDKALEELQALQPPAKEAMAEWQAEAQQRLNLVHALNSLSEVVEN